MVDQLTEIDLHYDTNTFAAHPRSSSSHPADGHRAQDVRLPLAQRGWTRLHDILHGGHFAALSVGTTHIDLPPELGPIAIAERVDEDPNYTADYHYLIRPDGYVALSTPAVSPEPVIAALREIAD